MARGSGESGAGEFDVRMQANVDDGAVIVRPDNGRVYVSPECTVRVLAQALGNDVWCKLSVEIAPGPIRVDME